MGFSENEKLVAEFFVSREGDEILDHIKEIDLIDEGILDSNKKFCNKNLIKKLTSQNLKLLMRCTILMIL